MRTTPTALLQEIPGGPALVDWFGRVPRFHDAELLDLVFPGHGAGRLRLHAWNITNELDVRGRFICDRHVVVTFDLQGVSAINCVDCDLMPGIILHLDISRSDELLRIEWSASYGVEGSFTVRQVRITLQPSAP